MIEEAAGYRPQRRGRRFIGPAFAAFCFGATLTGVLALTVLMGALLWTLVSRPSPPDNFKAIAENARTLPERLVRLATQKQNTEEPDRAGYRIGIVGSLWLLGMVAVLAIPVGVGTAVFLEEYPVPNRVRRIIQTNIANLAGVPSIVYGILGLTVFVRAFGISWLGLGPTLWAGAFTLSLLVLPVVVIATQESLRAVPSSLRQAALALGATRWQVIRDHTLPAARAGILTGTILALSRAIGETAPLLMVGAAGSLLVAPKGPSSRYTALPVEIYNYANEVDSEFQVVAAGGILLLLMLLLSMNAVAILIRNRANRSSRA